MKNDRRMKKFIEIYENSRLKQNFVNVKESRSEAVKKLEIVERNSTRKELFQILMAIQKQFYEENQIMKIEFEGMNQQIYEKNQIIDTRIKVFKEQQKLVKTLNLLEIPSSPPQCNSKLTESIEDLKSEIKSEKTQLDAIKVLNSEYKTESEQASSKVTYADKQLEKLKTLHKKQVEKLEAKYFKRENEILTEANQIRQEFETYKFKIDQELKIRSLLEERQSDFISGLISELKNTKVILQHPTLRLKTYEKLRQSMRSTEPETFPYLATPAPTSYRKHSILASRSSKISRRTKCSLKA